VKLWARVWCLSCFLTHSVDRGNPFPRWVYCNLFARSLLQLENRLPLTDDQDQTIIANSNPWRWLVTLTFNPRQALISTHTMQKINVNSHLVQKLEWKQTDGQTDTTDRITSPVICDRWIFVMCTIASTATSCRGTKAKGHLSNNLGSRQIGLRYDTIRDAILTCARKPTWVSLIYRTAPTTKKCKTEKN